MIARRSDIATYIVAAYALAWVLASIPWIDGKGLESVPWLHEGAALMMFAPTVAVLVARSRMRQPVLARPAAPGVAAAPGFAADVGLGLGPAPARTARLIVAAWLGTQMVLWIAYEISAALGWFHFDLDKLDTSMVAALLLETLTTVVISTLPNALGEEIGWRGWLLPQLISRYGTAVALIATGVIWALWHAPLTLLGYGFPDIGAWSAPAYIPFCICFGAVLGWLRLRSASVWPAAVAHASFNSAALIFGALQSADSSEHAHTLLGGSGIPGWILWAAVATALFAFAPIAKTPAPALQSSVQT